MSPSALGAADSVLCLGAHPDDIEIGLAGTLLRLSSRAPSPHFSFLIATASAERAAEARASATDLLGDGVDIEVGSFRDGFLPYDEPGKVKEWVRDSAPTRPDLVFVPSSEDRHQDHRFLGSLAWQLFRSSTILEYEIPKWEGDRSDANLLVELDEETMRAKVAHLMGHFPSQHGRRWYHPGLFEGLARVRGVEAGGDYAEAFVAQKIVWAAAQDGV